MLRYCFLLAGGVLIGSLPHAPGQPPAHPDDKSAAALHLSTKLVWKEGPASLPPGVKVALLEGDPAKEGTFVMRMKLPDGFVVAPHVHPKQERMTVLSGTLYFGMGEKFDAKACQPMPAGSYGTWPPGMKHFGYAKGETIIQLYGVGPWEIIYLNPDDDPRKAKKKG